MMRSVIGVLIVAGMVGLGSSGAQATGGLGGIGVIGDSYSDEYAFYPPHRSQARNWVELLATLRELDFGPYSVADRGEPRNQGYAYNWARSGATTDDMLSQGQHTGVAEQVARGEVRLVCVFIGGNDLLEALQEPDPPSALAEAARRAGDNLEVAVRTILDADEGVKILLATVPDLAELPELSGPDADEEGRWVEDASRAALRYNARVWAVAATDPRIAVVDLHLITRLSRTFFPKSIRIGTRQVARTGYGDEVDHAFLGDRRHIGTVVQGLLARVLVTAINRHLGTAIEPLTDGEILDVATRAASSSPELAGGTPSAASPAAGPETPSADR